MVKSIVQFAAAVVFGSAVSTDVHGQAPFFGIQEIYSNADGTVQFIQMNNVDSTSLAGQTLVAGGPSTDHSFTFPSDLPAGAINRSFLVATRGFAALGVLEPDYVIPNGFLSFPSGSISIGANKWAYVRLPIDGAYALWANPDSHSDDVANAIATNFAGRFYYLPGAIGAGLHASHTQVVVQGEPTGTTVRPIFVTNIGRSALTITSVSINQSPPRPYGHQFVAGGTCAPGTALAPQARCRVDVGLISGGYEHPTRYGGATLLITTDAGGGVTTVGLTGQVCDPQDCDFLTRFWADDVTPKWLDFPPTPVGKTFGPLRLKTFRYRGHEGFFFPAMLSGGNADSFSVDWADCTPRANSPDCDFRVVFAPQAEGPLATELVIYGPGSSVPAVFSITGQGGTLATRTKDVVEYYHAGLDHYFITASDEEAAALDSTHFQGWARTGRSFKAFAGDQPGSLPVCRLYIRPAYGSSHFYSTDPAECSQRAADTARYQLETSDAMHLYPPVEATGACPEDSVPVYRLWNRRADSNHLFTTDASLRDAMLERGYVAEGHGNAAVSMCAPRS